MKWIANIDICYAALRVAKKNQLTFTQNNSISYLNTFKIKF